MKAGLAALMTVASMALAVPDAQAHGVSAQVVIQAPVPAPVAVFGFSYGDPFAMGHVHYGPVACAHGPLYYYPTHGVYAHHYPRYRYTYYARPHYVNYRPAPYYNGGHRGWHKGNGHGHGHGGDRGHDRYSGRKGHYKVRGH